VLAKSLKSTVDRAGARSAPASLASNLRRPILTLLALLAVAIHVFVIQPHSDAQEGFNFQPGISAVALTGSDASTSSELPAHAPKPVCFICRAHAVAGIATLALPPLLQALTQTVIERPRVCNTVLPYLRATHSWQSRAPPVAV
jgi:hypothetical protein